MKKITCVVGYFGFYNNQLDGQTVKTREIYSLIQTKLTEKIEYFDTQSLKLNKLLVFKLIYCCIRAKTVVYLPAHSNLKNFFPILFIFSRLLRFEVIYVVVGGWLYEFLKGLPLHNWMLKRIQAIYPETELLANELISQYNYKNVKVLPNFRSIDFISIKEQNKFDKIKIVYMARINQNKGVETIFLLAKELKNRTLHNKVKIDFYGPIENSFKELFESEMFNYEFIEYKGILQSNEIHKTLSIYTFLVLPTQYYTEGFPGSILDAYIAGIPVIVTNWKHANEFVLNNKTGIIAQWDDKNDFVQKTIDLIEAPQKLNKMKVEINEFRKKFTQDYVWQIFETNFNNHLK